MGTSFLTWQRKHRQSIALHDRSDKMRWGHQIRRVCVYASVVYVLTLRRSPAVPRAYECASYLVLCFMCLLRSFTFILRTVYENLKQFHHKRFFWPSINNELEINYCTIKWRRHSKLIVKFCCRFESLCGIQKAQLSRRLIWISKEARWLAAR